MTNHRRAREIEVAKRVEHLVAHELVDIAQALAIEHAVAIDDHGVLKRAAARQPDGAHLIDLMQEAEGAGAADVALEALGVEGDGDVLAADRAAGEVDGEAHGEAVIGRERGGLAVLADGYRLQRLHAAASLARLVGP